MEQSQLNQAHKKLLTEQIIALGEAGHTIEGLQLRQMDWDTLKVHGMDFNQTAFQGNRFYQLDWKESTVMQSVFYQCHWHEGNWENISFIACRFINCRISGALLKLVNFSECEFENCIFDGVQIENVSLVMNDKVALNLVECRGEVLIFTDNKATTIAMERCALSKVVFTKFDFKQLQLKETTLTHLVVLESQAAGYDFSKMSLVFCQFTGSDLREANFAHSDVSQGGFMNCQLERANFTGANLKTTLFVKTKAQGANFSGTYAELANFSEADCQGANFDGANLLMAQMQHGQLQQASFRGSAMHFTDFSYADISRADFREGEFMRSRHHATRDYETRYGAKYGILPSDGTQLKADQWLKKR